MKVRTCYPWNFEFPWKTNVALCQYWLYLLGNWTMRPSNIGYIYSKLVTQALDLRCLDSPNVRTETVVKFETFEGGPLVVYDGAGNHSTSFKSRHYTASYFTELVFNIVMNRPFTIQDRQAVSIVQSPHAPQSVVVKYICLLKSH